MENTSERDKSSRTTYTVAGTLVVVEPAAAHLSVIVLEAALRSITLADTDEVVVSVRAVAFIGGVNTLTEPTCVCV
jgi:hypothetical protein